MKKLITLIACVALAGCGTTLFTSSTTTTLIVSAEKATSIAEDTIDTFLHLEYDHRAAYMAIDPEVHKFANKLRSDANHNGVQDGIDALISCRVATEAYKKSRSAADATTLNTALTALQAIIADCKKYTAEVTK